jgi:hypothetical protein
MISSKARVIVGWYQIISSILCSIYLYETLSKVITLEVASVLVLVLIVINFLSGYMLVTNRIGGFIVSLINQTIQIPILNMLGFSYTYFSFFHVGIYINSIGEMGWNIFIQPYFLFNPDAKSDLIVFGINFVAIFFGTFLLKNRDELK